MFLLAPVFGTRKDSDLRSPRLVLQCTLVGTDLRDRREVGRGGKEKNRTRLERSHKRRQGISSCLVINISEKREVGMIPEFRGEWINSIEV